MDMEKLTERARGFVQAAQTIALREQNQQLDTQHLLKALLDDREGLAAELLRSAGADPRKAADEADAAVRALPKVQGGNDRMYMSSSLARALGELFHIHERPLRRPTSISLRPINVA
jgi:ATP-dependent Clp protease ATP-binding subunit ClpB